MEEPKTGEVYKHFKGGYYLVLGLFTHTETNEIMVGYKAINSRQKYVRPLPMWNEIVDIDGYKGPRFTKDDNVRFEL